MTDSRALIAAVLAHLITAFLVFVLPFAGRFRFNQLKQRIAAGDPTAKLRFYRRGIIQQTLLAAIVLTWYSLARIRPSDIGLVAPSSWILSLFVISCITASIVYSVFHFRKTGDDKLKRALQNIGGIIPTSTVERRAFAAFGVGAGIVEELVCRGFLIYYLSTIIPFRDITVFVLLSSLIFGFAHLYQGRKGVLLTTILGICMAALYVTTGSLLVPVVIHVLLDLRLLWLFTPARLQSLSAEIPATNAQGA